MVQETEKVEVLLAMKKVMQASGLLPSFDWGSRAVLVRAAKACIELYGRIERFKEFLKEKKFVIGSNITYNNRSGIIRYIKWTPPSFTIRFDSGKPIQLKTEEFEKVLPRGAMKT